MAVNRKITGKETSLLKSLLKGTAAGIILTLAGCALMSRLIVGEVLKDTSIGYCATGILVISSYAAAVVAMRAAKEKTAVISLISGLIYYGILLLVNAFCFRRGYEGLPVTALLILAGTGGALLIQIRPHNKRRSPLRKNNRR